MGASQEMNQNHAKTLRTHRILFYHFIPAKAGMQLQLRDPRSLLQAYRDKHLLCKFRDGIQRLLSHYQFAFIFSHTFASSWINVGRLET